jgi:tetratricopeptide (TPR) repeat protein
MMEEKKKVIIGGEGSQLHWRQRLNPKKILKRHKLVAGGTQRTAEEAAALKRKQKTAVIAIFILLAGLLAFLNTGFYKRSVEQREVNKARATAEDAYKSRHFDTAAQDVIDQYEKTNPNSKETRAELASRIGSLYLADKKPKEALEWFKKSEQDASKDMGYSLAMNMGNAAQAAGDKQTAIDYYKKALKILESDPSQPYATDYYQGVQQMIRDLEKS